MNTVVQSWAMPGNFNFLYPAFAPAFKDTNATPGSYFYPTVKEKSEERDENPNDLVAITTAALGGQAPYSIRIATEPHELEALYRFRYRVSVEEMNREGKLADHKNKILKDQYDDSAINIVAFRGDEVVGSGRLNFSSLGKLPHRKFFNFDQLEKNRPNSVCWASKLLIDTRFRGSRLMYNIVRAFCEITHRKGIELSVVGCNLDVQPYFEKLGWKTYKSAEDYGGYGVSVPMMFDHTNIEYLQAIHSPLVRHYRLLEAARN